jgi:hypothetical protein
MKANLRKLNAQKLFWNQIVKMHYVGHFIDKREVDLITPQVMHCICHNNSILNLNPKTQTRRGLIKYNTTNGIIALRKHVNVGPIFIFIFNLKK